MPMVYHDDIQIRTTFIKVLDNILKQGTEFEVLGETVRSENYKKMVQVSVFLLLKLLLLLLFLTYYFLQR